MALITCELLFPCDVNVVCYNRLQHWHPVISWSNESINQAHTSHHKSVDQSRLVLSGHLIPVSAFLFSVSGFSSAAALNNSTKKKRTGGAGDMDWRRSRERGRGNWLFDVRIRRRSELQCVSVYLWHEGWVTHLHSDRVSFQERSHKQLAWMMAPSEAHSVSTFESRRLSMTVWVWFRCRRSWIFHSTELWPAGSGEGQFWCKMRVKFKGGSPLVMSVTACFTGTGVYKYALAICMYMAS